MKLCCLLLFAVNVIAVTARAAELTPGQEDAQETPAAISGVVQDDCGQPAQGATVWLVGGEYDEDAKAVAEVTSDPRGRFTFPVPDRGADFGPSLRPPSLIARYADGIGWAIDFERRLEEPPAEPLKIPLFPTGEFRGRIVDSSGKPIASARVSPSGLAEKTLADYREGWHFPSVTLFDKLKTELETETDAQSNFILRGLPTRGSAMATVTAPGFGAPWVRFDLSVPVTIRLDRAGSASGSLTAEADAGAVAGVEVRARLKSSQVRPEKAGFQLIVYAKVVTGEDGTFRFDELPAGTYDISPYLARKSGVYANPLEAVKVHAAETTARLTIPLHRALRLRGRVVDKETGAGIADVEIYFSRLVERTWLHAGTGTTDAEGNYTAYVRPGALSAKVLGAPKAYEIPPRARRPSEREVTEDSTWPVIQLTPAAALAGVVVDDSGDPIPGAEVHPFNVDRGLTLRVLRCGPDGKFALTRVPPRDALSLRARTDTAVTDAPVAILPSETDGQVRLVVSEKNAFGLRGTLLDETGAPVVHAKVQLWTVWHFGRFGRGSLRLSTLTTDAEGRFQTRALWPVDEYHIVVEAEGYDKWESARLRGRPGRTRDLAQIALRGASGFVEGIVVDSAGRPIPDTHVFNQGDALRPLNTQTDDAGRFRLEGFFMGPVYVFAQKAGHRFTGARTAANTGDLVIKLLRTDEPVPQPHWQYETPPFDRQKAAARKLLEKLWDVYKNGDDEWATRHIVRAMERIDPDQANAWSGGAEKKDAASLTGEELAKIADDDPDEALALLAEMSNLWAYSRAKYLAQRYLTSHPDKAARFAEEAVLRARTLEQPRRMSALADAGSLVVRLGSKDAGLKLIQEAADMAANLGTEDEEGSSRRRVALALAPHDPDRAIELLERITNRTERNLYVKEMAVAIGSQDPDKALEVLADLDSRPANEARMKIAYRWAATKPDLAVRLVDEMAEPKTSGSSNSRTKAEAFGWLAVAIAPQDKPLACRLIDRALAIYHDDPEAFSSWIFCGGRAAFAARVATQAHQIGYTDMDSVIWRVLAARPVGSEISLSSPVEVVRSRIRMALILALACPEAARYELEQVDHRGDLPGGGGSGWIDRKYWLPAWALADLDHAEELFEKELAAAHDDPEFDLSRSRLIETARVLSTPPEDRLHEMLRLDGALWFPD